MREDKFAAVAEKTLKFEGGYVNDPADPGGETNLGITVATARRGGYTGDMKDLTEETALLIYSKLYWAPLRLDDFEDPGLRLVMFDTGVNMGLAWPVLWVQAAVNSHSDNGSRWKRIVEDGIIGPVTIGTANTATTNPGTASAIKEFILNERSIRYKHLISRNPGLAKFENGWKSRVATLRTMVQHPAMRTAKKEEEADGSAPTPESPKEA